MTATERLRELLDERKAFWIAIDGQEDGLKSTCWKSGEDQEGYCYYNEDAFGVVALVVSQLTPEQAIAATLGSSNCTNGERTNGTCHMEYCDEWSGDELYPTEAYVCSACRYVTVDGKPNYCPNCGAKVVDPMTNDIDVEVDA